MRRLSKNIWVWFGFVVFLFSAWAFLQPLTSAIPQVIPLVYDFFLQPVWRYPIERPLIFLFFSGSLWFILASLYYRNKPISVLTASMGLYFDEDEKYPGEKVTVVTERIIRANRTNVKAYQITISPQPGKVLRRGIELSTKDAPFAARVYGEERSSWRCIFDFNSTLPYFPPLWHWMVIRKNSQGDGFEPWRWCASRLVTVRTVYRFDDCMNKLPEYWTRVINPLAHIVVKVKFNKEPGPFKAWHVTRASMNQLKVNKHMDPRVFEYSVSASNLMSGDDLLLTWSYK